MLKQDTKICNCKKSNCLKLYCECFANGSYCCPTKCNCVSCMNNFENETHRNMAIFSTLERNPNAFRSKIVAKEKLSHNKGCHCKKSFCLKKYCECFQGGIVCTAKCRCLECRNFDGSPDRNTLMLEPFMPAYDGFGSSSSSSATRPVDRLVSALGGHTTSSSSGSSSSSSSSSGGGGIIKVEVVTDEDTQSAVSNEPPDPPPESIQKIGDCLSDGAIALACEAMLSAVAKVANTNMERACGAMADAVTKKLSSIKKEKGITSSSSSSDDGGSTTDDETDPQHQQQRQNKRLKIETAATAASSSSSSTAGATTTSSSDDTTAVSPGGGAGAGNGEGKEAVVLRCFVDSLTTIVAHSVADGARQKTEEEEKNEFLEQLLHPNRPPGAPGRSAAASSTSSSLTSPTKAARSLFSNILAKSPGAASSSSSSSSAPTSTRPQRKRKKRAKPKYDDDDDEDDEYDYDHDGADDVEEKPNTKSSSASSSSSSILQQHQQHQQQQRLDHQLLIKQEEPAADRFTRMSSFGGLAATAAELDMYNANLSQASVGTFTMGDSQESLMDFSEFKTD